MKCCSPKRSAASDASPAAVVAKTATAAALAVSLEQNKQNRKDDYSDDEADKSEPKDTESSPDDKAINARFTRFYKNVPPNLNKHYKLLAKALKTDVFGGNKPVWIQEAMRTYHLAVLLDLNPTHDLSLAYRKRLIKKLAKSVSVMAKGPFAIAYNEKNLTNLYFKNEEPHHELQRFMKMKEIEKLLKFIDPLPEIEDVQTTSPTVEGSVARAEEVHIQPPIAEVWSRNHHGKRYRIH